MTERRGPSRSLAARCFPLRRRLSNVSGPARAACRRVPTGTGLEILVVGVAATDTAQRPACPHRLAHPRFSSNPPPLSPPIATDAPPRQRRPSADPNTVAPRRRCHEAVIPPRAADRPGLNSRSSCVSISCSILFGTTDSGDANFPSPRNSSTLRFSISFLPSNQILISFLFIIEIYNFEIVDERGGNRFIKYSFESVENPFIERMFRNTNGTNEITRSKKRIDSNG